MLAGLAVATAEPAHYQSSGISDWSKIPPPTQERTFKPPVPKRFKLGNGMALLVIENHALPLATVMLVVPGAGSAADPVGRLGLAALTTDLLDEGAGGLSAPGIADEVGRLGASLDLRTDPDAAYVSMQLLSAALEPSLDVFGKVVTQPAFDPNELARVKGDRTVELELRRDRPYEVAEVVMNGALYGPSSSYGHPGNGTREDFKAITLEDARSFYQSRWRPSAMTLIVAGDVDPVVVTRALDTRLGAWRPPGKHAIAKPAVVPAKLTHRLLLVDRPGVQQSDIQIGFVGLERKDPRYFAFEVLRSAIGDGFTCRVMQKLREELGILYHSYTYQDWRVRPGPFAIILPIETSATAQGISETLKIFHDLATNDMPAAELIKVKHNLIWAFPAEFSSNSDTVQAFGRLVLHGLPDNHYAGYVDQLRKVTAKHVKAIAKAMLAPPRVAIAVLGDLSKVRASLDALNLGSATEHDSYGVPR